MTIKAQIIDVFSGPGGLGEGFSAYKDEQGNFPFQIKISVEMEQYAHRTLRLRAFLRYFIHQNIKIPNIYIDYVSGENKFLGKLLEFRVFDDLKNDDSDELLTENDIREWDVLSPEAYCKNEYSEAQIKYKEEWGIVSRAIKIALYEARRMTLGPDEINIHKAIEQQIDPSVPSILIGGPPCQAFSTVGRSRRKGHVTNNIADNQSGSAVWDQDNDGRTWLYKEYIKIISEFKPDVFVMENVRGMLSAKISGENNRKVHVWKRIFSDLNKPSNVLGLEHSDIEYDIYSLAANVSFKGDAKDLLILDGNDFVLNSKNYGIPQARERVILLGIKKSVSNTLGPEFISHLSKISLNEQTHVRDAVGDLPALRSGVGRMEYFSDGHEKPKQQSVKKADESQFWNTILNDKLNAAVVRLEKSSDSHQFKVCGILKHAYGHHDALLKKKQAFNFITNAEFESTNESISKFHEFECSRLFENSRDKEHNKHVHKLMDWYSSYNEELWVLNHETRKHMDSDLCRYIYSSSYSLIKPVNGEKTFPRLAELEEARLDPKGHKNRESFIDRFRTQIWDKPATTVTSHISKDGHYYIHPDPSQMRSFTVREAARIQTFPDNYFFEGPRTAQFVQVGNAVPPFLAYKIAGVVNNIFSIIEK